MEVRTRQAGDVLVVELSGELAGVRKEDLLAGIAAGFGPACRSIVLDLSAVAYMDSMAIGALVEVRSNAVARGGEVAFAALQPAVRQIFTIIRFDRIFRIFDEVDAAVLAVGKRAT